jgi:hypothetical protein
MSPTSGGLESVAGSGTTAHVADRRAGSPARAWPPGAHPFAGTVSPRALAHLDPSRKPDLHWPLAAPDIRACGLSRPGRQGRDEIALPDHAEQAAGNTVGRPALLNGFIPEHTTVPESATSRRFPLSGTPLHPNWYPPAHLRQPRFAWLQEAVQSARIHSDLHADRLARSHGADAVTYGRHVFFRAGKLDLGSPRGTALLAHELTHVAQRDRITASSQEHFEREARGVERDVHGMLSFAPAAPAPWSTPPAAQLPLTLQFAGRPARETTGVRAGGHGAAPAQIAAASTPMKASEARPGADDTAGHQPTTPDMNELAEHVYRLFERKLQIDRERLGLRRG